MYTSDATRTGFATGNNILYNICYFASIAIVGHRHLKIYQRTPYNMTASKLQMKDEIRVTFGNDILYLCMTYTKFCEVLTNIIEH